MKIYKDMTLAEIIQMDIRALEILEKYNMGCRTCNAVYSETLEIAARANNINLEKLVHDLNQIMQ